ncbi:MAG TPA: ATP-binding cassette domain-containing protein [Roseiflexaceae bacterium]|nr:ATP-binding cassette domain-containing protein [Roseiflexaceae bacterium]
MSPAPSIDIQLVSYGYPPAAGNRGSFSAIAALRDVSLRIDPGEYIALLGHNGSGKSTLARHCNALLIPDSGRVLIAGRDTRDGRHVREIRDRVGMIFQNPDTQIIATVVEDDIAWSLAVRGMPAPLIRERVAWALEATGIAELRGLAPHRLSGGQRQRLAIASVLALRPDAIVADEPTAMLDPLARLAIVDLLHTLNREHGLTIVHATHLLEEAAHARRVVVMDGGRVAFDGTPAALFADLEQLRRLKLAIPEPIALAARLRAAGFRLDSAALTVEAIADQIISCCTDKCNE